MFDSINKGYNEKKRTQKEDKFIVESVLGTGNDDDGDEEDMIIDTESISPEDLDKIDKAMDGLVSSEDFDDQEIEELLGDDGEDFDDDDDESLDAVISECATRVEV